MTAWTKRPEFRALVLTALAAISLSACTESPRTQLSWNVEDHTYYGPRSVKLPPVEQHRLAPVQQQQASNNTYYAPKPKPRATPGWYTASNPQPAQPAPRAVSYEPQQTADSSVHFQWPVNGHVILNYGAADNGERNDGINIAAAQGAPVRAAASGTVSYCGNELKGYGNLVLIKHDNGYITAYAHVDSFVVNRSDRVLAGQVIAYAGATGDVTTPQLHFEIRGSNQRPVDPAALLPKSMRMASN
ncbi:MAG TPA: M23 family metallopeptidase [Rhizomicrobium sp.]|nr:M23 family metallopeptidase [Rhizomicrobium sp.]